MLGAATSRRLSRTLVALLSLWVAVSLGVAGGHGHVPIRDAPAGGSWVAAIAAPSPTSPCLACGLNRITAQPAEGVDLLGLLPPARRLSPAAGDAHPSPTLPASASPRAPPSGSAAAGPANP